MLFNIMYNVSQDEWLRKGAYVTMRCHRTMSQREVFIETCFAKRLRKLKDGNLVFQLIYRQSAQRMKTSRRGEQQLRQSLRYIM